MDRLRVFFSKEKNVAGTVLCDFWGLSFEQVFPCGLLLLGPLTLEDCGYTVRTHTQQVEMCTGRNWGLLQTASTSWPVLCVPQFQTCESSKAQVPTTVFLACALLGDGGGCRRWVLMGGRSVVCAPQRRYWDPHWAHMCTSCTAWSEQLCPPYVMFCITSAPKSNGSTDHELKPLKPRTKRNLLSSKMISSRLCQCLKAD